MLRAHRAAPATAAAATSAEQIAEEIAQAAGVAKVVEADVAVTRTTGESATTSARAESTRTGTRRDHLADLVVLLALLAVTEHVVCRGDLLEALLGVLVSRVGVGVELLGELSVRAATSFSVALCGTPRTE